MYWVDTQLSRLMQKLMSRQRWHDCVFTVTADHGEEFLDHDGRFHPPNRLNEELIHVPLVVRVPERTNRSIDLRSACWIWSDVTGRHQHKAPGRIPREEPMETVWATGQNGTNPCIAEAVDGCTNPFILNNRLRSRTMAVREGRYKMHFQFETATWQLFDLGVGPAGAISIPEDQQIRSTKRLLASPMIIFNIL